jgi:hypothetical protein
MKIFIVLKPRFLLWKVHKIYEAKNNNDNEEEELIEAHITSDFLRLHRFRLKMLFFCVKKFKREKFPHEISIQID